MLFITEDLVDRIVDIAVAAINKNLTELLLYKQAMASPDSECQNAAMYIGIESIHEQ